MSIPTAVSQILSLLPATTKEDQQQQQQSFSPSSSSSLFDPSQTLAISASRLGAPDQKFVAGTLSQLSQLDEEAFGIRPLHSMVIVGRRMHPVERDFAGRWAVDRDVWNRVCRDVYGCQE
jgi:diphthine synthase